MELQPKILRAKIFQLEEELWMLKENLKKAEGACEHKFSEVKYDPYSQPDYTNSSLSFPPHPDKINMKYVDRWKRECSLCGRVEYTQEFTTKTEKIPTFGLIKKEPLDAIITN